MGDFQSALKEKKSKFGVFYGGTTTKSFDRSRIFRYGLPKDILSKGQNTKGVGGAYSAPPHGLKG